jgi:uncharacterized RDD family membrane protein YckC
VTDETSYEEQVRSWSNIDLLDVAKHIDKDAHPGRHRIVQAEIERRMSLPAPEIVPPPPRPPVSKYATFWRRVGAIFIDGLILMPVAIGALLLAYASTDPVVQAGSGLALDLSEEKLTIAQAITRDLVPLSFSVASFVVIVNVGLPADLSESDYASLIPSLALLSISLLWWLAEILTMATNRKRRAVHDLIAGSVVLRSDAPAPVAPEADDGRHP